MKSTIVFVSALLFAFVASAADWDRAISVNGTCLKMVTSDRGSITVTADIQDKELAKATKRATESYEAVRAAVLKLALKDAQISTSEYNVSEVREWEKEKSVFKGFRARMGLRVATSETSRLGDVIAIAAKEGIRDVVALTTYLSEEKSKIERESCLESAVQNAFAKATRMAKAAGAKVGKSLTITEEGAPTPIPPRPRGEMKAMMMEADTAAPSVDASSGNIAVSVNVTYALE